MRNVNCPRLAYCTVPVERLELRHGLDAFDALRNPYAGACRAAGTTGGLRQHLA